VTSLSEVHGSVLVPRRPTFWRRLFAFVGPAYLVSVGYMDPGNWATDIAAGSRFGYALLWVLLMSNLMALLLQSLSARLGIVTGRDLAQGCRELFPRRIGLALWLLAEVAIAATDLAEVLGTAIGLKLLFGLPMLAGVLMTALDTLVLLFLQSRGMRMMEAFIVALVITIGACLGLEVVLARPEMASLAAGFVPSLPGDGALYLAIGILGATVMPHNLYLHSALVQSRRIVHTPAGVRSGVRFNVIDSAVALNGAFLVNAALLVMAAATFYETGHTGVAEMEEAHRLLEPLLGARVAPVAFAVALIAAGQSSTITGTLAGQVVMEGFVRVRVRPVVRRLITRGLALIPAVATILLAGEGASGRLLILSQVVLSLQLSFAAIPLVHLVSDRRWMGQYRVRPLAQASAWLVAGIIAALNLRRGRRLARGCRRYRAVDRRGRGGRGSGPRGPAGLRHHRPLRAKAPSRGVWRSPGSPRQRGHPCHRAAAGPAPDRGGSRLHGSRRRRRRVRRHARQAHRRPHPPASRGRIGGSARALRRARRHRGTHGPGAARAVRGRAGRAGRRG